MLFFVSQPLFSQNRIQVLIPTVEQETEYVWRTIRDIKFFEEHNYPVSLPPGEYIESLKEKSKAGTFGEEDYPELFRYMSAKVYNEKNYQEGKKKIEEQKDLVNNMANQIIRSKKKWSFKEFSAYSVRLTLYGSGGSYNPDDGSIIIWTTSTGKFRQYDNPANTLIHEIVHIGVEESIVNKFKVPHPFKERMIDQIVLLHFKDLLPNYRLQDMGDNRIDPYLKKKKDFKKLASIVNKLISDN